MSGLWFVVGVPKKEQEKLEKQDQKKREEAAALAAKNDINKRAQQLGEYVSYADNINTFSELNTKNNVVNSIYGNKKKWSPPTSPPPNNAAQPNVPVSLYEHTEPLEKVLEESLQELEIHDAVWTTDKSNKHYQIYFPCDYGVKSDKVLTTLTAKGFGHIGGSSLGIIPFTLYYHDGDDAKKLVQNLAAEDPGREPESGDEEEDFKNISKFKAVQQRFLNSVKARLTVAQVVQGIKSGASLTFDYVFYILAAAMVAAMGLMEDSSVSLIGAMLISPLMGPVLAASFGVMIGDSSLRNLGFRNVALSLMLIMCFGLLWGIIAMNWTSTWNADMSWPTSEMISRGTPRNLWSGALVAAPSGVAVGMAILAGNTASLVGVAIAASLLPPTVNCGILWSFAILKNIWAARETPTTMVVGHRNVTLPPSLLPPPDYVPQFHHNMSRECVVLGIISFCLTLVNISCIFICAIIMLKIKEVAPHTSVTKTQRFWKHDVKVAREYNKSIGKMDGSRLGKDFLQEWAVISGLDPQKVLSEEARMAQLQTLQDIVAEVENDEVYQSVIRSVPGGQPPDIFQHFDIPEDEAISDPSPSRRMSIHSSVLGIVDNNPMPRGSLADQAPRQRRQSRVMNWLGRRQSQDIQPDSTAINLEAANIDDSELKGLNGRRRSTLLRHTLQASGHNPHSLWPSRFQVTTVDEDGYGQAPAQGAGSRRRPTRAVVDINARRRVSLPPPRRFSFSPTVPSSVDNSMSRC